ncbi:MAG: Gldg family protein [Bacteroidetes bacterium]|nr:Gldg family protein [Bacteroidota bacterium]
MNPDEKATPSKPSTAKQKTKFNFAIQLVIVVGIVVVLNAFSSSIFRRFDLTDDSRHTISEVSESYLDTLPEQAYVTIYYGGELPTHYKQFEDGMRTLLEELTISSNGHLDYQFVDPGEDQGIIQRFAAKGLYPFRLRMPTSYTNQQEVQVLPFAMVTYKQKDVMINLIHGCTYMSQEGQPDFDVPCALQRFEYNLLTTIYNLSREKYKTIGLLTGHGEYPKERMSDLYNDIDHYYNVIRVDLRQGKPIGPSILDLLLVLQPQGALTEREKYEIDQYLMRGGKVIFAMDHEILDFTIGDQASTLTDLRATNLDDMLMKWGVKLNYNLVKDMQCGMITAGSYTASYGNEQRKAYWPWFPMIRNLSGHPATRYVSRLLMRYPASIDTFNIEGIRKTVLFKSSQRSWNKEGRQFINIDQELRARPDANLYTSGAQIMGLLVEGQFRSNFAGRGVPRDSMAPNPPQEAFLATTMNGRNPQVVVISDGEFAVGEQLGPNVMPLPEENKQVMINLIDIMTGQDLLTKLRAPIQ